MTELNWQSRMRFLGLVLNKGLEREKAQFNMEK
jgi:hypothetical protein